MGLKSINQFRSPVLHSFTFCLFIFVIYFLPDQKKKVREYFNVDIFVPLNYGIERMYTNPGGWYIHLHDNTASSLWTARKTGVGGGDKTQKNLITVTKSLLPIRLLPTPKNK